MLDYNSFKNFQEAKVRPISDHSIKVQNRVDDTYWKKVKVRMIRRTTDPTYFEHKIKLRENPDQPVGETIYEHIPCYTNQRNECFFCVGEKIDRPLQELYDAHCKLISYSTERYLHLYDSNQRGTTIERNENLKTTIFRNWENGLDAWGNRVYNNIKGSEDD